MNQELDSAQAFCAARDVAAAQACSMAAVSSNHDFLAAWESPGYSAYWWESFSGNDTKKKRVTD